ncbi:MAG: glycosyltransferase [Clostridia bacterium]|nr:glycosyltransferase [Clostridia bacterium]
MKVLVISHNPLGTQFNMSKTLVSLLSSLKREEMCQLYVYPALPDMDLCSSYFRVTDKDILSSYYKFRLNCGEVKPCCDTHNMYENLNDEKLYTNPKNKNDIRMLFRDAMWKCAHWYTKKLENWLEKENPTCIFVAPGPATFLYNIALKISKERNLPIVTYICDDYYFVNKPKSFIASFRVALLKKKICKLMQVTSKLVVICDALKNEFSKEFGVSTTTIMTGSDFIHLNNPKIAESPTKLSYFGNLSCNRHLSLADIGRELDLINKNKGTDLKLNIYTAEKNPDIISVFSDIKSVNIRPFISGDAFKSALLTSELLLHVEAFDEQSIDTVKHSVSTKIADSLASGIPFVAYGPSNVASLEYLISKECAIVATSNEEIENALCKAFFDKKARESVVCNAVKTAQTYHNSLENSKRLLSIFEEIQEKI